MILQQLCADAERIVGGMPPAMYVPRPVRWVIDLDEAGGFLNLTQTTGSGRRADRGQELLVPTLVRTSGVRPILLSDTPAYVLGKAPDDRRAAVKHQAFRDLVRLCAERTSSAAVGAVRRFLDAWDNGEVHEPRFADVSPSDLMAFRVRGAYPIEEQAVQEFWATHCDASANTSDAASQCLVCGASKPIAENLPIAIKGIPGGQTSGAALVSINCAAFESFGLPRAKTSCVCAECGERFGKALNHLLADERSRLRVGPLVYAFWTREEIGFSLNDFLERPEPGQVQDLLASYRSGDRRYLDAAADTDFYAAALSASGGRAVVRDWLHTTVGNARRNLARWFDLLEQVDEWGQPGAPLGVFRLAVSLYRDARDIAPQVPRNLVHVALHGGPLPLWMLEQALKRCRAQQDVTYPRAALIGAVLISQSDEMEVVHMADRELNESCPPELCGRLLAVLEETQRQAALPAKVGATVVDRFFGSASTAPASVFGNLLGQAQHHLAKMRKDKTKGGAYYALQKRLEEVMAPLTAFPATLSLKDQALFSLGYYHERAANRAAARERAAERDRAEEVESPTEEES